MRWKAPEADWHSLGGIRQDSSGSRQTTPPVRARGNAGIRAHGRRQLLPSARSAEPASPAALAARGRGRGAAAPRSDCSSRRSSAPRTPCGRRSPQWSRCSSPRCWCAASDGAALDAEPARTRGRGRANSGLAARYTRFILRWRWLVLAVLGVVTGTAVAVLPGIAAQGGNLSGILSTSGPTIQVQVDAIRRFGLPLLTRIAVVQRDPEGLSTQAITRALARAAVVDRKTLENGADPDRELFAAYPLINTRSLVPGAAERNTTIVTYLFTDPSANIFAQQAAAYRYAADIDQPGDGLVGVAGAVPAQIEQGSVIGAALPTVETVTLLIIAVVVSANFRSVAAPLITLGDRGDRVPARRPRPCRDVGSAEHPRRRRTRADRRRADPGDHHRLQHLLPRRAAGQAARRRTQPGRHRGRGPGVPAHRDHRRADGGLRRRRARRRAHRAVPGARPRTGGGRARRPDRGDHRRARAARDPGPVGVLARPLPRSRRQRSDGAIGGRRPRQQTRLSTTRRHPVRAYRREARTGSRRRRVGRPCAPGRSAESRATAAPPPSSPSS